LAFSARELLAFDQEDLLSHSITNPQGYVVEGGLDMPPLPGDRRINPGQLIIYNGVKDGEKIRVAAFALSLAGTSAKGVALIKVGETLTHRTDVARRATLAIILPMLLMTLTAAGAIAYGVGRGLDPVRRLQDRLVERPPLDLSPVPLAGTPAELRPFLDEINSLLHRLSEAVEAQSRFVAAAAHQLRTPIAGIRAQADAAIATGQPQDGQNALQRIAQAALGMGNLVQSGIGRECAPQLLAAKLNIGFVAEEAEAWVMGDAQLLREMLINLIDNAQRYGATQITLGVKGAGEAVYWHISDNGPGIPKDQREQVFAPFYRLSPSIEGAGIGLTIVARIARLHRAQISLDANPDGSGLAIQIAFPRVPT